MPKWVAYAAAWVLAAAAAMAVAWQGVGIVGSQVTEDRPAALSAAEVRQRLDEETTSTTTSAPPVEVVTTTVVGAPTPATSAPAGRPRTTSPAAPTTTMAQAAPAPTTTTTAAPAAETRTYNLVGGSVALRFSPSGVTVVWANPNPGFEVEQEPENGNGVQVEFRSESHRSRVDGWWDGGPQDRVREEPES